ncbi:MAG: PQQ-binding-like beta-propeller repeat protein [Pseudomonadota bacterium]
MASFNGRLTASAAVLVLVHASATLAQTLPTFTTAQADAGRTAYTQQCAACHGDALQGGQFGPALKGQAFQNKWGGAPLAELYTYIRRSMPPAAVGALGESTYAALLARIMADNGVGAGQVTLVTEPATLERMKVPGQARSSQAQLRPTAGLMSLTPGVRVPPWPVRANPLDRITPVTEAMISNPAPGEWLSWRRGHQGRGFSPLKEITRDNVNKLQMAWSLTLPPGPNTIEPLFHDGVLFVYGYGDRVFALDGENGDELWRYERRLPDNAPLTSKRTMALWGNKIIAATSDAHLVALDMKTGRVMWDRDVGQGTGRITGGPLVANGVVIQGLVGARIPGGSSIAAVDAETGEPLWRFRTVGQPGTPGGNSWNDLPADQRGGGSVWTSGTYDAELDLAYFGPGPTYDTGPMRFSVNKAGVTNDALYTDTTLAFRPRTGELVWHFQHMRNDQWDMDWAFERAIIPLQFNGRTRKAVVTSGKEGWFDALDAATGEYLTSFDMGLQNFIKGVDPKTGVKNIDPAMLPGGLDHTITICPWGGGGRNWMPTSHDIDRNVFYVVAVDACMALAPLPKGQTGGFLSTGVNASISPRPDSDGKYGVLQAIDTRTGKTLWKARQRAPQTTGVLATAGGVIFAGALDRRYSAYDAATGQKLWSVGLPEVPNGTPITYSMNGKQYVAMIAGYGSPSTTTWPGIVPEITLPPVRSSAVFVFALPEK